MEKLCKHYDVTQNHIVKTTKGGLGGGGGTVAHWQLALAYAQYLSPEIHLQVNQVFKNHVEELVDPELGMDRAQQRAVRSYQSMGKSNEWISRRLEGITTHNFFTQSLKDRDCKDWNSLKNISDIENRAILGCTAKKFKAQNGLPRSARTRNHLEESDISAFQFLETIATRKMRDEIAQGTKECTNIVSRVSSVMAVTYQKMLDA